MNTVTKEISRTLRQSVSKIVIALGLLTCVSVQANEEVDIKTLTSLMVMQNVQMVNEQLSQSLADDIELSVTMKLPKVEKSPIDYNSLIAQTVSSSANQSNNE